MGAITVTTRLAETGEPKEITVTGRFFVNNEGGFLGEYFVFPAIYVQSVALAPAGSREVPSGPHSSNAVWDFGMKAWIEPQPQAPPPQPPTQSERIAALEAKVAALEGGSMTASPVKRER